MIGPGNNTFPRMEGLLTPRRSGYCQIAQTHVYPVPDLRQPFLGVHFTLTAAGNVKIGPTAIPAFWRQHYGGLANFDLGECAEILARQAGLLFSNAGDFRSLAWSEVRKYSRRRIVELAAELVQGTRPAQYRRWGQAGIRAQLLDLETRTLDMDFRCLGDDRSFHVLNAVSPGFTSLSGCTRGPSTTSVPVSASKS